MSSYSVIPLIALIAYTPLLFLVLRQRPWQRQHKLLTLYLATAMAWSLSSLLLHSNFFLEYKTLLVQALIAFVTLMGTHYYFFCYNFGYKPWGFGIKLGYGFTLLFVILAALGYIPQSVSFTFGKPITIEYGPYLWLLAFPMLFLAGMLLFSLAKKLRISSDPGEQNRLIYLLFSISILVLFNSTNLVPLFRGYPIDHAGNALNAGILTYATLRYELVSVKFVARRSLAYLGTAIAVAGAFLVVLSTLYYGFGLVLNFITLFVAIVITAALMGSFWYPMQRFLTRLADRILYGERLDYREIAFDASRHAQSILNIKDIGKELTRLVAGASGAKSAYLLLQERRKRDFVSQFVFPEMGNSPTSALRLRHDSPIVGWLSREGKYLRREELDVLPEFTSLWQQERKAVESADIELFVPLLARNKLVAVLALTRAKSRNTYDIDDLELLRFVSGQAAIMIDNAQLYTESKAITDDLRLINRLTQIITSSLNMNEVYERFIAELRKVMDADWASIALIEGDNLHLVALTSLATSEWKQGETMPLKGTGTAYVTKTKKTLIEKDLSQRHKFWTGEVHLKAGIRSILYVPLISKGEAIGALIIGSFRPNAYEARQVALLDQLAAQIAVVMENSRLYEEIRAQAIRDELTGLLNRRHFEQRLSEEIERHSRYGGNFCLIISDLDRFKDYNDTYGHRAGDKLLWEVAQIVKESVRGVDLVFRYGGDEFGILLPQTTIEDAHIVSERVRTQIETDMETRGIALTVSLGIASWPTDGITPDDVVRAADATLYQAKQSGGNRTLIFSEIASSPIKHAIARISDEKMALSTVHALVAAVDAKDRYTFRHSRLVVTYAKALAKAAGLPPQKIAIIETAALLHDVGKIGIPDELLNKKGKLTAEEWEMLQSHSSVGVTIIGHVPKLAPCLPIILHHHERYNGLGYPKNLKGEEAPLEARILAVADAFAAMISVRPYRPALSYKEAIEELRRGAGTQFDPKLVDFFVPIALSLITEEITSLEGSSEK